MRFLAPRSVLVSIPSDRLAAVSMVTVVTLVMMVTMMTMGAGGSQAAAMASEAAPQAPQASPGAATAPPAAVTLSPPRLLLEALERTSPGWITMENESSPQGGHLVIERLVWPLFYLHWKPLSGAGGVGGRLSVAEAEQAVASLWKGVVLDPPPHGQKVAMPAHEAVLIEGTTSHGEWKSRYFVWACPESGRLYIADMNASLQATVPPQLFELMASMARSVRCHADAHIEELPPPAKRYDIPGTDISYGIPYAWAPVAGYRVQEVFGTGQFSTKDHPAVTSEVGQDVALELDSVRRLNVIWEAAPDSAMTFDALAQRVQAFWQERANNMMPGETRTSNDVWMMDGLVQMRSGLGVPPARMHKFRAWAWRKNGTSYLAVGQLGGVRFGQRIMSEVRDIANPMLEELFQSIEY